MCFSASYNFLPISLLHQNFSFMMNKQGLSCSKHSTGLSFTRLKNSRGGRSLEVVYKYSRSILIHPLLYKWLYFINKLNTIIKGQLPKKQEQLRSNELRPYDFGSSLAKCPVHFFHHVKYYFRFKQLIGFLVWGQLCCIFR